MIRNIFITLLLCVFSAIDSFAGPEAEFKKVLISWNVLENGSVEMNYCKELNLHTHNSFNNLYGETFIVYDPLYQSVKVNKSYTVQADGNVIQTPQNAFNEVLPRDAADAPAYNHLKELVITHTGLEIGATIYLDYTVTSKPGYLPALDFDLPLEELSPVREARVSVTVPSGINVNEMLFGKPSRKIQKEQDKDTYLYVFKNIPARPRETLMPAYSTGARVIINTYGKGTDPFDYMRAQFNKAESCPELETLASSLNSEQAVMDFVGKKLGNSPLSIQQTGYRMRSPRDIYRSAYGTQAEKMLLAYVLLRSKGHNPQIHAQYPSQLTWPGKGLASLTGISLTPPSEDAAVVIDLNETIHLTAREAERALYELPVPNNALAAWRLGTLNSVRKNPLELPAIVSEHYEYTITWDEDVCPEVKEMHKIISNRAGKLEISFSKKDNEIKIVRSLSLPEKNISPEAYADFRTLLNTWNSVQYRSIIVLKKK